MLIPGLALLDNIVFLVLHALSSAKTYANNAYTPAKTPQSKG